MMTFDDKFKVEKDYWIKKLSGYSKNSKGIFGVSNENKIQKKTGVLKIGLPNNITNKIIKISNKSDQGVYIILVATIRHLLGKYGRYNDVVMGIPIMKFNDIKLIHNELLPLIINIDSELTFKQLLTFTAQSIKECYKYGNFPLNKIIGPSNSEYKDFDFLFEVVVLLKNIHKDKKLMSLGTNLLFQFDLNHESLYLEIEYNSFVYEEEQIKKMSQNLIYCLGEAINNPDMKLYNIEILNKDEKDKLLLEFNNTQVNFGKYKTLHELFKEQVEKKPNNIAIIYKNSKLTYKELDEKSNAIAYLLKGNGIRGNAIVGLLLDRSIEMIIGILGVLKAGGAYLPIDPSNPKDRIKYILNDSASKTLIHNNKDISDLMFEGNIIDLSICEFQNFKIVDIQSSVDDLAYVIYTSGTTGNPKGVMISHYSAINLLYSLAGQFNNGINEEDRILSLTNYAFDVSVSEIFIALINGSTLVINDKHKTFDVKEITKLIVNNEVTYTYIPPLLLVDVYEELMIYKNDAKLNKILVGVEPIKSKVLNNFYNLNENIEIINGYGPTESTICSTFYKFSKDEDKDKFIPIGKPISNTKIYILDKQNNILPIGTAGEICIAGYGLAMGYLNKPELTAEKFVDNPFDQGTKMYRTGDLARWLPDGNIEFLGRIDNQVKIRGFRIELGEIESRILQHEDVKETTVIVIDGKDQDKHICAYIVSDKELSELNLRDYLKESLPEYMIPSYFLSLDKMPITSNGKLDRRVLPKPNLDERLINYEAPRNDLEETLVKIWSEVLGIEKLGINDSFFELGGHSLKAMTLISKIHKETNKEVPLKELFKSPTIKGLSKFIEEAEESIYSKIEKVEDREYYEASSAQKRMYVIQVFDKESVAYNMSQVFEIQGSINKSKIEDTFKDLAQRHEALRTYFETVENEIVQKIDNNYELKLKEEVSNKSIEEIANDFVKPFDLGKAPLFRSEVVETHGKTYLLIDMHHIISDGVSMSILVNEFVTLYNGGTLEALKLQYKDFATWQNDLLKSEDMKKQEEYWINVFNDEIPVLNMPTDYERPSVQSFEGDSVSCEVDKNVAFKLKELTKKTETTMHMVLLSAFNILLSKYSGQEDIVVGTPIAGRPHADLQSIMGMFVNTLALRNKPDGNKIYLDFLNEVKENSLKAYDNESYQLETLIEKLDIPREVSRNPLFDVMFNMVDTVADIEIKLKDMELIPYGSENNEAKFDLTLNAIEQNDEINISIVYCSKLFNKNSIERLVKHYLAILDIITKNSCIKLGEIELLSDEERNLILNEFNDTKIEYPNDKTIQELFEEQVQKTPYNIAVMFEGKKLTYRELNEKANSLARSLIIRGVKSESVVGIISYKSLEMIIGLIAILKAGAVYLPIDINYPKERIEYMLNDSKSNVLLNIDDSLADIDFKGEIINLSDENLFDGCVDNLDKINGGNSLAYVIYTSGTTGRPKGVMCEHKNVIRLVKNMNYIEFKYDDKILQTGSMSFDASTFEVWGALLNGLELHLAKNEVILIGEKLEKFICDNNITILWLTSQLFNQLVQDNINIFKNLRYLLVGGDVISPKCINLVRSLNKNLKIINGYGPTENTTFSTTYLIDKEYNSNIPIGKPIANSTVYIVDRNEKLLPIGLYGELCVSGDGLARGYLNNFKLTNEKFVDNPFEIGTKMYKTGDLARWLPDGNIEFLGRIDNQVKIRGFRIELGEIESKILQHEDVKEATVIVIDGKDNDKHICSYIVSDKEVSGLNLRDYLKESLPEYMIPSYFVKLDKMPITANGKLDRRALPKPNLDERLTSYEAPRNALEETLVRVWSEILGVQKIGINDNFFELGGHSLKAMTLISKIHKETNKEVTLKELFKSPTIKGLSKFIEEAEESVYSKIEKVEEREHYEASSAQKRMYIIQGINKESIAYNMPQIFEIEGIKDKNKIEETFRKLISRHEALRTYFETIEGEIVQKIDKSYEFKLDQEVSNQSIEEIANGFVIPFDLSKAPLFRAQIVETQSKKYLLIDMHHIISDGVSMSILMSEFERLYNGQELQSLSVQYKDFAAWQNNFLKTEAIRSQEEYWINIFKDNIPVLELPYDYERTSIKSLDGSSIEFEIDNVVTNKLKQLVIKTETTMHMVVLSAFTILLSKYSGQEDIIIGVPISGRRHSDVQNIMGVFINTLALRNKPKGDKKFIEFLTEVKENSLKAYDNQDYQLETLIQKLNIVREQSRNPLFDVIFNTLNIEGEAIKLNEITLTPIISENKTAKFDLNLSLVEGMDNLQLTFIYCQDLFNKESIEIMRDDFIDILNKISENYNMSLQNICKSEMNCKKNIQMDDEFYF